MTAFADVEATLNLQPGELYLARTPAILRTILGSCVGVTFWCPESGAGAMCHGVLPRCPAGNLATLTRAERQRYVDFAIRFLARQFDSIGASRRKVQVKLFGGSDVLPVDRRLGHATVGAQNCAAALEVLRDEGFTIAASDLGGRRGRRIEFYTGSGEVRIHRLADWAEGH